MTNLLPKILYRGDADSNKMRNLKSFCLTGFLCTNLSNRGSGCEIFSTPFLNLIARHVEPGWPTTHFLSFTENYNTATKYASGKSNLKLLRASESQWDSVVLHLDTSKFTSFSMIYTGIYLCKYLGRLPSGATGTDFPRLVGNTYHGERIIQIQKKKK